MAQLSKKIFVDISAFISFIDRADLNHTKAVQVFEELGTDEYHVFTSSSVVLNTYFRIEREISTIVANDFLQAILESNIEILYPSKSELSTALRISKANPGRTASLSQIINSDLMEKNGIRHVFTFDFWNNLLGTNLSPLLQQQS